MIKKEDTGNVSSCQIKYCVSRCLKALTKDAVFLILGKTKTSSIRIVNVTLKTLTKHLPNKTRQNEDQDPNEHV